MVVSYSFDFERFIMLDIPPISLATVLTVLSILSILGTLIYSIISNYFKEHQTLNTMGEAIEEISCTMKEVKVALDEIPKLRAEIDNLKENDCATSGLVKNILHLVFVIGNDMVKNGANGELKRAVSGLRDTVLDNVAGKQL